MIVSRSRFPVALFVLGTMLAALTMLAISVGSFPVPLPKVIAVLWAALTGADAEVADNMRVVVLQVRAPRVIAALAVGAALASAGAGYQNLFRNPLVSPDILGVSAGCALGAVTGILLSLPFLLIQAFAFGGGIVAVGLVLAVGAWVRGGDRVLTLVLTGVVVGSLFGAGVAFVKVLADPYNQLPAIVYWLLGSFTGVLLVGPVPPNSNLSGWLFNVARPDTLKNGAFAHLARMPEGPPNTAVPCERNSV